jgi:hypothetical protein
VSGEAPVRGSATVVYAIFAMHANKRVFLLEDITVALGTLDNDNIGYGVVTRIL